MFIWALKNWRIIAVALAVLSVAGGLWYYGHTKYRQGFDECTTAQERAQTEAVKNTTKEKDKINVKEQSLDDPAIDAGLRKLGIMRRSEDR